MTTETTTEKPGISAAIIVSDGRVLMVRRRISEGELMWQFPAGAIEPGEVATEAAVRETSSASGCTRRPAG
jgi:8-oxo-dGTP diphosphatase